MKNVDLVDEVIVNLSMSNSSGKEGHHSSLTDGGGARLVLQRGDHAGMAVD